MARSTFKVLFYVNGSKEKDGIVPIMGRVTINGTVAQFSCKQTIPKTLWDAKGNRAKGKSAEARNINLALDNIKAQIIKHYQRISDREAFVTAEMVRNAYQGIGSEYETLIKAFDKDCANFLKRVGKDRSIGTYKVMVRARNYVAAFIKSFYKRTDMSMLELTPDFIKEFAAYLTAERGLKNATIWLNCMWLKGVVMRAHYNGLIPRNPFAQFHISPNVKEREYLTEDEIKRIMAHEFDNPTPSIGAGPVQLTDPDCLPRQLRKGDGEIRIATWGTGLGSTAHYHHAVLSGLEKEKMKPLKPKPDCCRRRRPKRRRN